jgi:exonuclease III
MRVVSWNLAYMKPARFKEVENRHRQWEFLRSLQPDIAMLQECRPEDLTNLAPFEMKNEYKILFTDSALYEKLISCKVIRSEMSDDLSDHVPIVANFDLA